jgi:hypothetical protein
MERVLVFFIKKGAGTMGQEFFVQVFVTVRKNPRPVTIFQFKVC